MVILKRKIEIYIVYVKEEKRDTRQGTRRETPKLKRKMHFKSNKNTFF